MKRVFLIVLLSVAGAGLSGAQMTTASTNALGAHLNYGRGCAACHSPHRGGFADGNTKPADSSSNTGALWGENLGRLYGRTVSTGGGKFVEVLPANPSATTPDVAGMMSCLACHDGNYAPQAMMKNRVFESLPATYGISNSIPTLMGTGDGGSYLNDHPMGLSARIGCGGENWDCAEIDGMIRMSGANSSQFVSNYGFFVKPGNYNNTAVVVCTTCHDPHSMNVVTVSSSTSGLPPGTYTTMFFLRGPYNPNDTHRSSNQTAQFCRQCHGDKSNEMYGGTARTVF
jgi:hypothetical protein